jgi:4-methylaminobutanoate oxidase (formaldehyde-forming)
MKSIVIGGGVIGASVAFHLAREPGADVVLLERERLSAGTTWHSAGNITWKPIPHHDEAVLYGLDTVAALEGMGLATGWLKTGRLFIGRTAPTLDSYAEFDRAARARGFGSRWLAPAEAQALNPHLAPEKAEGIWLNPLSGRLNPTDLTQAYATAARRAGAKIAEGTDALAIATDGGRVTGVETREGFLPADLVVVAAGLWSRALFQPLGVHLAQWPCEHFYVLADVAPRLTRQTPSFVSPDDLLYGREEVGSLLVGLFDEDAKTIDPADLPEPFSFTLLAPDWDKIAPYFSRAVELFPALATAPIRRFVNGPESFTPDGLPLIGPLAGIEGLLVATAMNSVGVTWSAMTGALIASLAAGREPGFSAASYAPGRFGERGSDLPWLKAQVSGIVSSGYRKATLAPAPAD